MRTVPKPCNEKKTAEKTGCGISGTSETENAYQVFPALHDDWKKTEFTESTGVAPKRRKSLLSEYSIIQSRIPASCKSDYFQKIPKIIWQTMKSNHVPFIMKSFSDSWIENNPEYEYRFCDDDEVFAFIKSDFPEYSEGYRKIKYGASRADLWRYLIIYQYGGVYADLDCRCLSPLRTWIKPDSEYVTQLGVNKDVCQWLIISIPKNPIFLRAAERSLQNIENKTTDLEYRGFEVKDQKLVFRKQVPAVTIKDRIIGLAGPPVLQKVTEECFEDGSIDAILKSTQVVCTSKGRSCQMNGNVLHDYKNPEYKKALTALKTPHYAYGRRFINLMERLKSYF
jgi:hypothetical protein